MDAKEALDHVNAEKSKLETYAEKIGGEVKADIDGIYIRIKTDRTVAILCGVLGFVLGAVTLDVIVHVLR